MIRVLLLDDHELVRDGVHASMDAAADIEVVGESGTADNAFDEVTRCRPDVAVVDVRLSDGIDIGIGIDIAHGGQLFEPARIRPGRAMR